MTHFSIEQLTDQPDRIYVEIDRRLNIALIRDESGLDIRVYPRTDGELWDDPFTVLTIDEQEIIALEKELTAEATIQTNLDAPKTAAIDYAKVNLIALLEQRRQIAQIWSIADVLELRSDLNDDQAWAVLQQCDKWLDSERGICWDTLEMYADDLFPRPAKGDDA